MHPRAYIFDLDGTLVDSLRDIADALNHALDEHHLPTASLDMVRGWVGSGLRTLCERACSLAAADVVERVIRSTKSHYQSRVIVHTRLYPNIMQMLDLLKMRGALLCVLSNKPHALAVEVVQRLGVMPFFTEVRGPASEAARKPSAEGAIAILQRLKVTPEDAFMVGDSAIDITTARNTGMISVGVGWGFRSVEELVSAGADFLVSDPLEIPALEKK